MAAAGAQSLDVTRHAVASGGGRSSGGSFSVNGTVGQADASPRLDGGAFELRGGYWSSAAQTSGDTLFRDSFEDP
jgi:hypothetical protein